MNRLIRSRPISAALALLFILSAGAGCMGLTETKFSDGSLSASLSFPEGGGSDSSLSINLSRHIIVTDAAIDMEGRSKSYGSVSGSIDFSNPGLSVAFDGNIAVAPPNGKPNAYEINNITLDRALQYSDDVKVAMKAANAFAYHLFEFDMTEVEPTDFNIMWEGFGWLLDNTGSGNTAGDIYIYNSVSGKWESKDSFSLKDILNEDHILWANVSSKASDYVDSRGYLSAMVTISLPPLPQFTGYIETDYVALWYNGTRVLFPENVKLDIKGDGSVEWQRGGKLRTKVNFNGTGFVGALQAVLDAAQTETVKIPLKLSSDGGGILFVSNLSISYDMKNMAPTLNGTIPKLEMDEDTNATALLELGSYFKDDGGVNALTYTMVYEQDNTLLDAELNADGHHVDFFTKTPNWWGELVFRVRAADIELLTVEASFTVKVRSVDDPPKMKSPGALTAREGAPFEATFAATDIDVGVDQADYLVFSTSSTYLTLESDTGRAYFTPVNEQVGYHMFNVTVTDFYGLSDTRNLTMRIDNVNNGPSLRPVPDQTATEDVPFLLQLNATDPDLAIGQDTLLFEDNTTLFVIGPANGTISFTPTNRDVGERFVSVTVTDQAGLKAKSDFMITVLNVNDPPRPLPVRDQTVEEDQNLSFRVNATDEDAGDELSFLDNSPLFDINATGWVRFRPAQKDVGVHLINVTVTDKAGAGASVLFNITVVNVNDPPLNARVTRPFNGTAFKQGENITFEGNATDEDGDALNYTWFLGSEELGTGKTFTTTSLKPGAYVITLTVSDGTLSATTAPIQITVKKKATVAPAKGFIPGFELLLLAAALGACALLARRMRR